MKQHKTDIAVIGAGPVGLFSVFEAGLLKMRCHLLDYLPVPGGQLAEIYPQKPIYDIPGYPVILAKDLVANLLKQIEPFHPQFTLGERVEEIQISPNDKFIIRTHCDTIIECPVIAIAGGLGCFEPRKPDLRNLTTYENRGVDYIVKDPEKYRNKKLVIAGGGDSALDWAIYLSNLCSELSLIHRRSEFRGAPESVSRLEDLVKAGKLQLILNDEVESLEGSGKLQIVTLKNAKHKTIHTDYFLPLFGLSPKLGPIANWGLQIDKNAIEVNPEDYSTSIPGIFAIGDINNYPGKLKLILCGFHEATLMMQSAYKIVNKGKKASFKYTTVTGITELQ